MGQFRLISADSHVMEPANFWVEHVDKKFKDQAPRVVAKPDGQGLVFTGPGLSPFPGGWWLRHRPQRRRTKRAHEERLRGGASQRLGPGRAHQGSGRRWGRG